ncbi:protein PIN-LIKES 5-like isoform X2 [Cornus florida]|uniref:protein PIN-LIKES 5-like isoform X2 n=1 Tax=Cornus florida TaxID=4283 RepID=UPI00289981D5|nr:protein PIN-LIKES 5-like isoform X2 [Cornus florida]
MGFWTLFEVASMPMLQVLIITSLGAFMATDYLNLLPPHARKSLNKIVFTVLNPCLLYSSLSQTVTLKDIISWWFMPLNIGLIFLFGGTLGWIVVKILKPKPHLEGLIIALCSTGNFGNILLILVPAICKENGSPFGDHKVCATIGISYASFSMALGAFYVWTFTFQLMRSSSLKYKLLQEAESSPKVPNEDLDANGKTHLLKGNQEHGGIVVPSIKSIVEDTENQLIVPQVSTLELEKGNASFWSKICGVLHQLLHVVLEPPFLAVVGGFMVGANKWLNNLFIGTTAPLRVLQESSKLLGDGTIPCITLILGGNLSGMSKVKLRPLIIVSVVCVRYVILPVIGIGVVKQAAKLGFLPPDPLYHFILYIQYTLPPAMAIGTMSQLFDVAQDECSVLFLWTYLVASLAMTVWSTIYMWMLSF